MFLFINDIRSPVLSDSFSVFAFLRLFIKQTTIQCFNNCFRPNQWNMVSGYHWFCNDNLLTYQNCNPFPFSALIVINGVRIELNSMSCGYSLIASKWLCHETVWWERQNNADKDVCASIPWCDEICALSTRGKERKSRKNLQIYVLHILTNSKQRNSGMKHAVTDLWNWKSDGNPDQSCNLYCRA